MAKRRVQPMSEVLAELMARRGYARLEASRSYDEAWREAAGEQVAQRSRVGVVRGGKLEVVVANSVLVQELMFQKKAILAKLKDGLPEERISDLRLRVGPID